MMRNLTILVLVLGVFLTGGCASSTGSGNVTSPGFSGSESYCGEFWFRPSGGTVRDNGDFEIWWEGTTPPPNFGWEVKNLDTPHQLFCEPGLNISLKYREMVGWSYPIYRYVYLCYPVNWEDDTNYLIKVLLPAGEVASAHFYYLYGGW